MENSIKESEDFLKELYNDILSDKKLKFIFKIALYSKNYQANITDLLFKLNDINTNLEELREDTRFQVFVEKSNSYLNVLKKNEKCLKIELTDLGVKLARSLEYNDKSLKTNTFPLKVKNVKVYITLLIMKVILIVLGSLIIGLFIAPVFYKELRETLLYIFAAIGASHIIINYFKNK